MLNSLSDCKVSVIVPNYNYARYLPARIDSVLGQTFQDFELILLDDASTDESAIVLGRYADNPHVSQLVINEQNTGSPFAQWARGLQLARGRYVWIAEADDLAEPSFLEQTVRVLDERPQAAFCFVGSRHIDQDGQPMARDVNHWGRRQLGCTQGYAAFDGRCYAKRNFYWRNYVPNASGALFRREAALRSLDIECQSMRSSGDWLFWFMMALEGDVVEVYSMLNSFRQHTAKVTVHAESTGRNRQEDICILQRMGQLLPEISAFRRHLRHGKYYNRIGRMHTTPAIRTELRAFAIERLHTGRVDGLLAHICHFLALFLPFVPSMKNDRLRPS